MEITQRELSAAYRKAGASALNKVAAKARTEAVRAITDRYNVKASDVRKMVEIQSATANKLEALIVVRHTKRMPYIKFPAKQLQSGTVVRVRSDRSTIVRHAFIQTMQSGHKGVFIRKGEKRRMTRGASVGKMRQPIVEMAGPRISTMYKTSGAIDRVKETGKKLYEVLKHELQFRLNRGA